MLCGNCGKPAELACGSCNEHLLDETEALTHYCDSKCQEADWVKHKAECRRIRNISDTNLLYRVTSVSQELFYVYLELCWTKLNIKRVEKKGEKIVMYGKVPQNVCWPKNYLVFPSHLVPDEEDKKAVLTFAAGRDAVIWMTEFIYGLLGNVVQKTELIEVKTKNTRRQMRMIHKPIPGQRPLRRSTHLLLKVTLRSRDEFAVDVAGAQYGYCDPITPWDEYMANRVLRIVSSGEPPQPYDVLHTDNYSLATMDACRSDLSIPKELLRTKLVGRLIIEVVSYHSLEWQYYGNFSLREMWKLPEKAFIWRSGNFVDFIEWRIHSMDQRKYFTVNGHLLTEKFPDNNWGFAQPGTLSNARV